MNLDTKNWKNFFLKDLYSIRMGNGFDKNKLNEDLQEINLVSRVSYNNGVDIKVGRVENVEPFRAGLLTVALGGSYLGSCFVQEEPFYTAQNVAVMEAKTAEMTKLVNIFISGLVRYESKTKYYAFGRELNTHIRTDFDIKLPILIDDSGAPIIDKSKDFSEDGYIPDWNWIDSYMRTLHHKNITTTNNSNSSLSLQVNEWMEFKLTNLFEIERGDITSLNEIDEGNTPIVSASGENEGISFYGNVLPKYENMITVSMNGVNTGFVAYHNYKFTTNVDCCVLKQKFTMTPYIGIFLTTVLSQLKIKYSYGRKMSAERICTESIKLPIQKNSDGSPYFDENKTFSETGFVPDWQFMEAYIKALPYGDRI